MPCRLRRPGQDLSAGLLIAETEPVTERARVREIGSVVNWRRAQIVLLSAQGMDVPAIAKVAFTSEDRVRDVIRAFNADGFDSLYPKYRGGRPPKFTLGQRREIKKIAKSKPAEHDLSFSEPGAWPSWRTSWWPRGWSTTSATRACGSCSARRISHHAHLTGKAAAAARAVAEGGTIRCGR